jgi:hypothetical protein
MSGIELSPAWVLILGGGAGAAPAREGARRHGRARSASRDGALSRLPAGEFGRLGFWATSSSSCARTAGVCCSPGCSSSPRWLSGDLLAARARLGSAAAGSPTRAPRSARLRRRPADAVRLLGADRRHLGVPHLGAAQRARLPCGHALPHRVQLTSGMLLLFGALQQLAATGSCASSTSDSMRPAGC